MLSGELKLNNSGDFNKVISEGTISALIVL